MTMPTQTPNVVVKNPTVRRRAGVILGVAGIALGAAMTLDAAAPGLDWSTVTAPALAVYGYLAGVFQLAVTTPNVPRY